MPLQEAIIDGFSADELDRLGQRFLELHGSDIVADLDSPGSLEPWKRKWEQTKAEYREGRAMEDIHGGEPDDESYLDADAA